MKTKRLPTIKVMELNVLETDKQSRISMCMKFRYISDKATEN